MLRLFNIVFLLLLIAAGGFYWVVAAGYAAALGLASGLDWLAQPMTVSRSSWRW